MPIILSATQATILEYLLVICDERHPLPSIADISVDCDMSYSQAVYAVNGLYTLGYIERKKSDYCGAKVYWLSKNCTQLDYIVRYHRSFQREFIEVPRNYEEALAVGY